MRVKSNGERSLPLTAMRSGQCSQAWSVRLRFMRPVWCIHILLLALAEVPSRNCRSEDQPVMRQSWQGMVMLYIWVDTMPRVTGSLEPGMAKGP